MLSKTNKYATCYQLNPQYKAPYKVISSDGKLYEWEHNKRMLIGSRKTRLKKLFLYTIKANKQWQSISREGHMKDERMVELVKNHVDISISHNLDDWSNVYAEYIMNLLRWL